MFLGFFFWEQKNEKKRSSNTAEDKGESFSTETKVSLHYTRLPGLDYLIPLVFCNEKPIFVWFYYRLSLRKTNNI